MRVRSRSYSVGLAVVLVMALTALIAPWLVPYDPAEQLDPAAGRHLPPLTSRHAIGPTNDKGHCLL